MVLVSIDSLEQLRWAYRLQCRQWQRRLEDLSPAAREILADAWRVLHCATDLDGLVGRMDELQRQFAAAAPRVYFAELGAA